MAWNIRGEVEVASGEPFASLARRFELARGRRANALGMSMATGGLESELHAHREAQLFYLVRGAFLCETEDARWIVAPQSAMWIPGGCDHRIAARAPVEGYALFVEPDAAPNLPRECCAVSVTPLFRELLLRLAKRPLDYKRGTPDARMVAVLVDELAHVAIENHRLPMPRDPRLRKLVDAITAHPADAATAATWAKRIGMGERTLHRVLVAETGLSFSRWRQQLHVILALQKLARGASVQSVASDLGYESSSFVTMFRRAMGTSPARYMRDR